MRSLLVLCVAMTACSSSDNHSKPAAAEPASDDSDEVGKPAPPATNADGANELEVLLLSELAVAARCSDAASPFRPWCIAATGWGDATSAPLPGDGSVLVGLTVELEKSKSTLDALTNRVTLSALAFRTEGDKSYGQITMIKSQSDAESRMAAEAVAGASAVFKGKAQLVTIHVDLAQYLKTLPAKAEYPIAKGKISWAWSGASLAELRKSGDHWITIEKPTQGAPGIFVSLFTDKTSM